MRCDARPPRWLLALSVAGSLGTLACTGNGTTKPSDGQTTEAKQDDGGKQVEPEPGQTTAAEPTPDPEPEKDIYGGPRMDDGAEPVPEPEKTLYGGPRMEEPVPEPTPEEMPKPMYGGPRMDEPPSE